MNLIQFTKDNGGRGVGVVDGAKAHVVKGADSVYRLALRAAADGVKLKTLIAKVDRTKTVWFVLQMDEPARGSGVSASTRS